MPCLSVLVFGLFPATVRASTPEFSAAEVHTAGLAANAMRDLLRSASMPVNPSARRLKSCWDDCGTMPFDYGDNLTVCKAPTRCSGFGATKTDLGKLHSNCLADCPSKNRLQAQMMCDTRKFCVDQGGTGACTLTLDVVDNSDVLTRCSNCTAETEPFFTELDKIDTNAPDFHVVQLMGDLINKDVCPKVIAAGRCVLDKSPGCVAIDATTEKYLYRDYSALTFAGFCECPCFAEFAKMLALIEVGDWKACQDMIADNFTTPFPGIAAAGLAMLQSGVTECLGCGDNALKCQNAFVKYFPPSTVQDLAAVIVSKAACTTSPGPETGSTTVAAQAPDATGDVDASFCHRSAVPFMASAALVAILQLF